MKKIILGIFILLAACDKSTSDEVLTEINVKDEYNDYYDCALGQNDEVIKPGDVDIEKYTTVFEDSGYEKNGYTAQGSILNKDVDNYSFQTQIYEINDTITCDFSLSAQGIDTFRSIHTIAPEITDDGSITVLFFAEFYDDNGKYIISYDVNNKEIVSFYKISAEEGSSPPDKELVKDVIPTIANDYLRELNNIFNNDSYELTGIKSNKSKYSTQEEITSCFNELDGQYKDLTIEEFQKYFEDKDYKTTNVDDNIVELEKPSNLSDGSFSIRMSQDPVNKNVSYCTLFHTTEEDEKYGSTIINGKAEDITSNIVSIRTESGVFSFDLDNKAILSSTINEETDLSSYYEIMEAYINEFNSIINEEE